MAKVLFLATCEPELSGAALEALGAAQSLAKELAAELVCGLVGADCAAAKTIAACGAAEIFCVSGPEFAAPRYVSDAAAFTAICKAAQADYVLAPADSRVSRALPGVAQRLGAKIDTQVTGLKVESGKPVISRWYYRQRMQGTLCRETKPWFISLSSGCFAKAALEAGEAKISELKAELAAPRSKVIEVKSPSADQQTIRPEAKTLFVAGAGWTKKQADGKPHADLASELILGFVRGATASLGSSKSLVDLSGEGQAVLPFLTHMHQVGQTGSTPRHQKGLATCCHGEEPHVVGWRFIGERRAVNLDASCGWAQGKADVLYVADAFAVMEKVNALLCQ